MEFENLEFDNLEFENSEFKDSDFEHLKIENWNWTQTTAKVYLLPVCTYCSI